MILKDGSVASEVDVDNGCAHVKLYDASGNALLIDGAQRQVVTPRSPDVGALGMYRHYDETGAIAATLAADSVLFSWRWTHASRIALIEYIRVSAVVNADITVMVPMSLEAVVGRSFSGSHTGGNAFTISGNNAKMKTAFATMSLGEARIATTAALGGGTITPDSHGIGGVMFGAPAGVAAVKAGSALLPKTPLYEWRAGEGYPLYLVQNEGFIIRNPLIGPATGSFRVGIEVGWSEVTAFA